MPRILVALLLMVATLPSLASHAVHQESTGNKTPILHGISDEGHYYPAFDHAYYFVDGTGQANPQLEQNVDELIQGFGFKPLKGVSENFGYEHRVHWILIPLHSYDLQESDKYLEFDYPLLDFIDLYVLQAGQPWKLTYQTGDMRPYDSRPIDHRVFFFPIPEKTDYLLLRLQTEGSLVMPIAIVNGAHVYTHQNNTTLGYGLFFGALMIMCVYNLFVYFFTREQGYFFYVSTLFFILLYQLAMSGYGYEWIWRENGQWVNEHIQPITVGLTLASVCLFTREVLQLKHYFPLFDTAFLIASRLSLATAFMGFFTPLSLLIHFISILPMVIISMVLVAGAYAYRSNVSGSGLFLLAWSAGLLGAFLFALHQLGILPSSPIYVHSLKVGVLLNTVLLSFTLVSHINFLKAEKQRAEQVAHDNYRLALIDSLTGIPNRRAFDHQFRLEYRRSQREGSPLSVLMIDVDYFKAYNDTYGHRKGDEVLAKVAKTLSGDLARPGDSLFRYGGEEFVVLLPDTDIKGAVYLADRLVKGISEDRIPHNASPLEHLTISIGVGTETRFEADSLAIIEEADAALYDAKSNGRNQYQMGKSSKNIHVLRGSQSS